MWYVLQTITGKEEELVRMIRKLVPPDLYSDCFVAYYERIWRKQQQSMVHVERLFPGYAFIIAQDPNELFLRLKQVPAMSKMIADGEFTFFSLDEDEEDFLRNMLEGDHIVRLSYVATDGRGRVSRVSGPLESYLSQVVRYQFKKRYAIIRLRLLGAEKTAALGILLNEDVRQELLYGKIETPLRMPERYEVPRPRSGYGQQSYAGSGSQASAVPGQQPHACSGSKPLSGQRQGDVALAVGDRVRVIDGTLENMSGVIWAIRKNAVEIGVRLFGQDMGMEVPIECVCKKEIV